MILFQSGTIILTPRIENQTRLRNVKLDIILTCNTYVDMRGVVQNRESPDYRLPEVGRYVLLLSFAKLDRNITSVSLERQLKMYVI